MNRPLEEASARQISSEKSFLDQIAAKKVAKNRLYHTILFWRDYDYDDFTFSTYTDKILMYGG